MQNKSFDLGSDKKMEADGGILSGGVFDMVVGSGPIVQAVLFLLIIQSLMSWAITIGKILQFRKTTRQSEEFQEVFWETRDIGRANGSTRRLLDGYVTQLFIAGFRELSQLAQKMNASGRVIGAQDLEPVKRAVERAGLQQSHRLEHGVTFLATTASSAPFIGLFGTVWGIMNAFHSLGSSNLTTIQAVAPGISEALVATAIGLGAAIPAAVAYNYFTVAIRRARESMDRFQDEFLVVAGESLG